MKIKVRYKVSESKTVLVVGQNLYDCWWMLIAECPNFKYKVSYEQFQNEVEVAFVSDSTPSRFWQDDGKPLRDDDDLAAGACDGQPAQILRYLDSKLEIEPTCRTLS